MGCGHRDRAVSLIVSASVARRRHRARRRSVHRIGARHDDDEQLGGARIVAYDTISAVHWRICEAADGRMDQRRLTSA